MMKQFHNDNLPIEFFSSEEKLEKWFEKNGQKREGFWLKIAKKESGIKSVNYSDALDIALCFGWIDGQKDKFDEQYWLQRFTPRRPKSMWSKINVGRVEELIKSNRMKSSGMNQVELAKSDGRWKAAYESQRNLKMPDDFKAELSKFPEAMEFYNKLTSVNKYAICFRLAEAKKPETRQKRFELYLEMLKKKQKIH